MNIKRALIDNLKNIRGWTTDRKIVVFSVDDYGNVRLDSKEAREKMDKDGLKVYTRFDAYDTLETRQDLEALYDVLTSVKDKHGKHAVFTPFALPCNINFEAMAKEGYQRYIPENLPDTYAKLEERHPDAYTGAWALWQEGIEKGIMAPQFHGREHLNLKVFEEKLEKKGAEVLTALKNRSYTSLSEVNKPYGYTAAFGFETNDDVESHKNILKDGIEKFVEVYGLRPSSFTPPAARFHNALEDLLRQRNITNIHRAFLEDKSLNYTGGIRKSGLKNIVRNVVFEPTANNRVDEVEQAVQQIESAFKWNRPAIISSHRVNFCGFIDEKNREKGLSSLSFLLNQIVKRWENVEFMSMDALSQLFLK